MLFKLWFFNVFVYEGSLFFHYFLFEIWVIILFILQVNFHNNFVSLKFGIRGFWLKAH